jgi:hypothetical protein
MNPDRHKGLIRVSVGRCQWVVVKKWNEGYYLLSVTD